jgi:hypothetical protein
METEIEGMLDLAPETLHTQMILIIGGDDG